MNALQEEIIVKNRKGIHGAVATELAKITDRYDATVYFVGNNSKVDCASILEVLSMGFVHGSRLVVKTEGREADRVMNAVRELLSRSEDP